MYALVWSPSKIWVAALILLQQLLPNALTRSPLAHVFLTFLSANFKVLDRLWSEKRSIHRKKYQIPKLGFSDKFPFSKPNLGYYMGKTQKFNDENICLAINRV